MKTIPKATKTALKRVRRILYTTVVVCILFGALVGFTTALVVN